MSAFTPEVLAFLRAENARLSAGVDVDELARRIDAGAFTGIWQRSAEDIAVSIGTSLGGMPTPVALRHNPWDVQDLLTATFRSDDPVQSAPVAAPVTPAAPGVSAEELAFIMAAGSTPSTGATLRDATAEELAFLTSMTPTASGGWTAIRDEDASFLLIDPPDHLGVPAAAVAKQIVKSSTAKAVLGGLGLSGGSLAANEVVQRLAPPQSEAGQEFTQGLYGGADLVAVLPVVHPGAFLQGILPDSGPMLGIGDGPWKGLEVIDELARRQPPPAGPAALIPETFYLADSAKGFKDSPVRQALKEGSELSAFGAGFTLGVWGGITSEGARGIADAFTGPPEPERIESIARPEAYGRVGGIMEADTRAPSGRAPSLKDRITDFLDAPLSGLSLGPIAPEEEAPDEQANAKVSGPAGVVPGDLGNGAADGEEQAEAGDDSSTHGLLTPGAPYLPFHAGFKAPDSGPVGPPMPALAGEEGWSGPPVPVPPALDPSTAALLTSSAPGGLPSFTGTSMTSVLGLSSSFLGAAQSAAGSVVAAARENPLAASAIGATAVLGTAAGIDMARGEQSAIRRTVRRASSSRKKKSSKKKRSSSSGKKRKASCARKPMKRKASGKARVSSGKGKREDRRGVTRSTYRGQRVHTYKGRHYVVRKRAEGKMPAGTWKFINS